MVANFALLRLIFALLRLIFAVVVVNLAATIVFCALLGPIFTLLGVMFVDFVAIRLRGLSSARSQRSRSSWSRSLRDPHRLRSVDPLRRRVARLGPTAGGISRLPGRRSGRVGPTSSKRQPRSRTGTL